MTASVGESLRAFAAAVSPREKWKPSQWAELAPRIIPDNGSNPEPGKFHGDRTPYMREIIDTTDMPGVEIVVLRAPTQSGKTTAIENLVGYWIDMDPGAVMLVMPDEKSAKDFLSDRILKTIEATPSLRRHITPRSWDVKADRINLDTMPIMTAWAGSATRLASWPIRRILFDEVDKYPPFTGAESDPISLGLKRLSNWKHRSVALITSTPTTRDGNIMVWWDRCGDRRYFWVPCPFCREYQRFVFPQVKWPQLDGTPAQKADKIRIENLAHYECEHCKKAIKDEAKHAMLSRGKWASEDQTVVGGQVIGDRRKSSRIGFYLNAIYSPWVTFSHLASEFVGAANNQAALMDFRNSRMAEPFEETVSTVQVTALENKPAWKPGIVPRWAKVVIATADVQKGHAWYTVRAWGFEMRSMLIAYGVAVAGDGADFDELLNRTMRMSFADDRGNPINPAVLLIDSRYRTDEVYALAATMPDRIWPIMGAKPLTAAPVVDSPVRAFPNVIRRTINTQLWKDTLHRLIHDTDATKWGVFTGIGDDYKQQMRSERKAFDRTMGAAYWVPVTSGAANHLWDCECYQVCGAQLLGMSQSEPTDDPPPESSPSRPSEGNSRTNPIIGYRNRW